MALWLLRLRPQQVSESSDSAVNCRRREIENYDVVVIGGGICGVSVAAFLAEAGLSVAVLEPTAIAAAASGRNSGVIQQPFDAHLASLHRETLEIYRELALEAAEFELADAPAGLLIISPDHDAVSAATATIAAEEPELSAELIDSAKLAAMEPSLAPGLAACRLETGWPVAPAAATRAMADRAARGGAVLRIGDGVESVVVSEGMATGVRLASGAQIGCGRVVVAAGPWTPELVPGWSGSARIRAVWGVVVSVRLEEAPRHVLEELGIDRPGRPPDELFSLVTAGPDSSVGSTFLGERPDPAARAPGLLSRAAEFVPALAGSNQLAVRACARPLSFDGRPFIGAVPAVTGLYVCAGHGPWGISTGPGSARRLTELMLGRGTEDPVFAPARS